jgi:hypothetical protein
LYLDLTEEDAGQGMKQLGAEDWFIDVILELFHSLFASTKI